MTSQFPKTPQPHAFSDSTNIPGTGRNVTFAQTPGGRDLFGSPALRAPDSACTSRKKDMFRQRRMDKAHASRDESGMGGMSGAMGFSGQQQVEHDLGTLRSEYELLYPQPVQLIRGAGSGPGLVRGHRHAPSSHMDGNTSLAGGTSLGAGFLSPQQNSFLSGGGLGGMGGLTPIAANISVATPHQHLSISALGHDDGVPMNSMLRAATANDDGPPADGWVTVFGFPQGYQDGVLRHLRDRGEVLESHYSGSNYIAVRFSNTEAVADALALNGTILPADGMPGDNFMVGVKRGSHIKSSDRQGGADTMNIGGLSGSINFGAKLAASQQGVVKGAERDLGISVQALSQRNRDRGVVHGFGRFLSELLDISDTGSAF